MAECIDRQKELTKRFRNLTAVAQVSLEIPPGQIFGLLGVSGIAFHVSISVLAGFMIVSIGVGTYFFNRMEI